MVLDCTPCVQKNLNMGSICNLLIGCNQDHWTGIPILAESEETTRVLDINITCTYINYLIVHLLVHFHHNLRFPTATVGLLFQHSTVKSPVAVRYDTNAAKDMDGCSHNVDVYIIMFKDRPAGWLADCLAIQLYPHSVI